MSKLKKTIVWLIGLAPVLVFAQEPTIKGVIEAVTKLLGSVIPILMVLATAVFFWGVIKYLGAAGLIVKKEGASVKRIKEAKNIIIYGVIGLFLAVAMWGIARVIASTFGLESDRIFDLSEIQFNWPFE